MLILNYSHPLTTEQLAQLQALIGQPPDEVRDIRTQMDPSRPFAEQTAALVDAAALSAEAWQTVPLIVVPPSLNFAAAALLAELHGRMGYFPPIVRLRLVEGALPPRYEVAEVINLEQIRVEARRRR